MLVLNGGNQTNGSAAYHRDFALSRIGRLAMLWMATIDGERALSLYEKIGSIEGV